MELTVIYSLTLLQLISVFAVPDNSICCAGNCNNCNQFCNSCTQNCNNCNQICNSCTQNCNSCKQICNSCCGNNNCCPTRGDCCLQTCLSSGHSSSSTIASTSTTHSTGHSNSSTIASTSTTRSTDDSSSSTFTSSFASTATSEVTGDFTVPTIADAQQSNSPVVAAVVSCVGALCVVVAVVVGFLLLRRKQQSQGVRTEDSPICCPAVANPDDRQNSIHVYDRLSREHRRADNDKEPENTPDKRSKDDEYTYIDEATIIKMTGRLDEDHQPATTATEQPTNTNPGSGLHTDLSPLYRLAGAVNNGFTDPQPPDYFTLENDESRCAEPTQYFILEERGEKKSPADTDTQQYFTLEDGHEGAGRESASQLMSPGSGADYFELERPSDRQSDCAGVVRYEEARGPPEDAEYSRLEPNGLEHSEYTLLTHPAHQVSTVGDNPYSLASGVE